MAVRDAKAINTFQEGAVGVHFWLYVSRSTLPEAEIDQSIEDIVRVAQERNAALGITGALVYSDLHFGQIVEGPPESIMTLRSSILVDPRHTDIRTISDGRTGHRRFGQWALGYSGHSMVISRALQRAIRDAAHSNLNAGGDLLFLMEEVLAPR
jgi:hypothetical protein